MSWPRRVVFDTSTLLGAALKPGSLPHQALILALARCDVCASVPTWLELERVMQRERLDRFLPRDARLEFVAMLRTSMHFFPVTQANVDALQRKSLMAGIALALVVVWLLYGGFYAWIGARLAAQIAFVSAIAQLLFCVGYARGRSYYLLARLSNGLALLAVHLALGGFASSGYVLVYAMTPLFLATALEEPRYVRYWMAATLGVMMLAGVGEMLIPHGNFL